MMEKASEVRAAAVYLDRVKPGWWANVDPLLLDMRQSCTCIAGQSGIAWCAGNASVGEYAWVDGKRLGPFGTDRDYEPLWLEEIAARMPAAADLDRFTVESAPARQAEKEPVGARAAGGPGKNRPQ